MQKVIVLVSVILSIFMFNNDGDELKTQLFKDKPPKHSTEELYQDIFATLLAPYIDKAVEDYYDNSYTVAPYDTEVLSVERPNGYRTFAFRLKLKILPYLGPHNTVGEDHLIIL